MPLRRWHRWAAIPAGLLLFFVALTGVLLHLDMIRLGQQPPGHGTPVRQAAQPLPSNAELAAMVARVADAARADPALEVRTIQIDLTGPRITVGAGAGGAPGGARLLLDARTGERITPPAPPADYHYVLQDLHAGYFLGWTGRILSILCGIALAILSVTGVQLWWDMRRRGRKKGLYWK
ncbi:putative iron-regulated membrane protein [Sphingobium jiangsuense]|uniref:Putative iron-regulated membrane protein n=1 Tax=Sphingobium jiangsuense TaxID=870476 RepID=A0A7W6BLA3_9SPHN|nr:PepSY-associated TM helix domain-containing protein [Sphingobium jiangsuense]MBB3925657.1 putative iron-regulated membrane protein [Sphingobium jiangsuense]